MSIYRIIIHSMAFRRLWMATNIPSSSRHIINHSLYSTICVRFPVSMSMKQLTPTVIIESSAESNLFLCRITTAAAKLWTERAQWGSLETLCEHRFLIWKTIVDLSLHKCVINQFIKLINCKLIYPIGAHTRSNRKTPPFSIEGLINVMEEW